MILLSLLLLVIGIGTLMGSLAPETKSKYPPHKIKKMRIISAVFTGIGLILFAGSLSTDNRCPLNVGSEYILKINDTMLPVPAATDPKYLDLHLRVLTNDKTLTLKEKVLDNELLKRKAIVMLKPGTKVELEDLGIKNSQVFIEEGKYMGAIVYVRTDWLQCENQKNE